MDEASIKRIPPNDIDAEKAVIGSMLLEKEAIVVAEEVLSSDDFYSDKTG